MSNLARKYNRSYNAIDTYFHLHETPTNEKDCYHKLMFLHDAMAARFPDWRFKEPKYSKRRKRLIKMLLAFNSGHLVMS